VSVKDKRLWTFIVRGGEQIVLQPKGNIPEEHEGGRSVMRFVLTDEDAEATETLLKNHGCEVEKSTVRQTDEQEKERQELAGVMRDEMVFPSTACLACTFFDPHIEGNCGVTGWAPESVESLLEHRDKAKTDLAECPLEKYLEVQ